MEIEVVVESPRGSGNKYEMDPASAAIRAVIRHFFEVYKDLEPDRRSEVRGWDARSAAESAVREARRRHEKQEV